MIRLKDILAEASINNSTRIHMSKSPMTLNKKSYEQDIAMKPAGFWYGFGKSWIQWTKSEMPEWSGKYIYEVIIKTGNVLKIDTYEKLLKFNEEFSSQSAPGVSFIDWANVAKKYDGIEIVPYQTKARMNYNLLWYYGWDVASGCVWNLDTVTLRLITS